MRLALCRNVLPTATLTCAMRAYALPDFVSGLSHSLLYTYRLC